MKFFSDFALSRKKKKYRIKVWMNAKKCPNSKTMLFDVRFFRAKQFAAILRIVVPERSIAKIVGVTLIRKLRRKNQKENAEIIERYYWILSFIIQRKKLLANIWNFLWMFWHSAQEEGNNCSERMFFTNILFSLTYVSYRDIPPKIRLIFGALHMLKSDCNILYMI